jgi:hypothetical protein
MPRKREQYEILSVVGAPHQGAVQRVHVLLSRPVGRGFEGVFEALDERDPRGYLGEVRYRPIPRGSPSEVRSCAF